MTAAQSVRMFSGFFAEFILSEVEGLRMTGTEFE